MGDEFDRASFELEFDSLDHLWEWMQSQGVRAVSTNRVSVGEFVIQYDDSGHMDKAQIAHRSFKGNVEADE